MWCLSTFQLLSAIALAKADFQLFNLSTFLFGSNVFIFQFFLTFTDSQGGLAHPVPIAIGSYREARACEKKCSLFTGGLAQLARACDWQSQGQGFDSPNLHFNNQTVIKYVYGCLFYLNTQSNTQIGF